jgi:signal transduction histidine kinase
VQVFDNLIDNAIKYAASGKWLGVSVSQSGRWVTAEVSDHGEGIPPAELSRVFERFYRRKGTRHRGAGLGLAIVRQVVEDHKGTVRMSSTSGQGSRVEIVLPMV